MIIRKNAPNGCSASVKCCKNSSLWNLNSI